MNKKIIGICGIVLFIVIAVVIGVVLNNRNNKEIYSKRFDFDKGSCGIKIYDNGDVFQDLEVEDPNHKENYKKIRTLSKNKIKEIKNKLKNKDKNELDNYIKKVIYGSTELDLGIIMLNSEIVE